LVSEARNDGVALQTLAAADKAVRDAIAKHGSQSEQVVETLQQYATLLHEFGYAEQATRVRDRVRLMTEALQRRASSARVEQEATTDLFNSRGEHIAVFANENLYAPSGKHLGRWSDDLQVFLSRKGNYLGAVGYENRLVRDKNWQFRNVNFGDRGNEGDRAGWTHRPDIEPVVMDAWLEDVHLNENE
jgi:hypothetical protein